MRSAIVLIAICSLSCKSPTPGAVSRSRPSRAVAELHHTEDVPDEDAGAHDMQDSVAPFVISSTTCADAAILRQAEQALDSGAEIICNLSDGGVGFIVRRNPSRAKRGGRLIATVLHRMISGMSDAQLRAEYANTEREARTDRDRYTSIGMIRRAPDRTLGKSVVFDGSVQEIREVDGSTSMYVATDLVGREQVKVIFPALADDSVVSGARVRVYGIYTASESSTSALTNENTPIIYAWIVRPIRERL